jgi:hypothetical protein
MTIRKIITRILLAASVLASGCGTVPPYPAGSALPGPNPIVGWAASWSQDLGKLDKAIRDDYQDYISKLSREERMSMGPVGISEDGLGRHAITIQIAWYGTDWAHVLFYDKDNKRVKVTRYVAGHYRC